MNIKRIHFFSNLLAEFLWVPLWYYYYEQKRLVVNEQKRLVVNKQKKTSIYDFNYFSIQLSSYFVFPDRTLKLVSGLFVLKQQTRKPFKSNNKAIQIFVFVFYFVFSFQTNYDFKLAFLASFFYNILKYCCLDLPF